MTDPSTWQHRPEIGGLIQGPGFSFTTLVAIDGDHLRVRRRTDSDEDETRIPLNLLRQVLDPFTIRVNNQPVSFRDLTAEERQIFPGGLPDTTRYVYLQHACKPGDDITYTGLDPSFQELWVRFPCDFADGNMRLGNLRLLRETPDPLTSLPNLADVLARLIRANHLREHHGEDTLGVLLKAGAARTFRPSKGPPYNAIERDNLDDPLVRLAALVDDRLSLLDR